MCMCVLSSPPGSLCCRLLASKAAQALFLLRTLTAANINRMVLRLADSTRKALSELVRQSVACTIRNSAK